MGCGMLGTASFTTAHIAELVRGLRSVQGVGAGGGVQEARVVP